MEHMSHRMLNKSFVFQLLSPIFHRLSSVQISRMTHNKIVEHVQFDNGFSRQGIKREETRQEDLHTRRRKKKAEKGTTRGGAHSPGQGQAPWMCQRGSSKDFATPEARYQGGRSRSTPCRQFQKNAVQRQSVAVEQALRPSRPLITCHLTRHGASLQQRLFLSPSRQRLKETRPSTKWRLGSLQRARPWRKRQGGLVRSGHRAHSSTNKGA